MKGKSTGSSFQDIRLDPDGCQTGGTTWKGPRRSEEVRNKPKHTVSRVPRGKTKQHGRVSRKRCRTTRRMPTTTARKNSRVPDESAVARWRMCVRTPPNVGIVLEKLDERLENDPPLQELQVEQFESTVFAHAVSSSHVRFTGCIHDRRNNYLWAAVGRNGNACYKSTMCTLQICCNSTPRLPWFDNDVVLVVTCWVPSSFG